MHAPLAVAKQLAVSFVRRERVAAILDEAEHVVEIPAREPGVRRRACDLAIERVWVERCAASGEQDMLRQHVEPTRPRRIAVQFARRDAEYGGFALQHLEAIGGHEDRPRSLVHPMVGAAYPLQQARDALGCADLDHLDRPRPSRCRDRARRWRPPLAGAPPPSRLPPAFAARCRDCRDATRSAASPRSASTAPGTSSPPAPGC